ncbi:MAG: methylenetetrahydrofolate reductase [Pseudodesulfovibrio sp.]|uniref:Methylenetetrahydrofolate reductase n=1 Tax=Pseudodesulfovibrio aespoeensis (strain ATCC 700646 / DSM 10631 / Aspo-2) TaxID=643562 RepID=E6VUT5_PSEA9|nr:MULTISPECIES: methylenetetrahydrofolate reductase [Pseudodesulfovibrio]MBU4380056.1 methylenetetrahydrofolate reductase [Pseudomonadota bacterium]ADU62326.1 Methylenetetrahydrofolate reductase (NAD(P)H) [Pseudodesulfovibrio aespoeensis Aspo-2]MBU4474009.1 methylenetetrahydrofolate reductase [Pseudomonadota bacterium]MBU4515207.1 methylenetetrahydrofolate reductase [Pseudomonadota bacterium]MBU4521112.1 methylenetetrahydrofolate reductase [Pseudomonadota bacterium]
MHVCDLIEKNTPFISLEFFPPKEKDAWPGFFDVVEKLKDLGPLFASVTYGAGGGTQDNTLEIATRMKRDHGIEPIVHLTSVGASAAKLDTFLAGLSAAGLENVLALRGDPPKGQEDFSFDSQEFKHATDVIEFISRRYPNICVGGAAYPESHPESPSIQSDLDMVNLKVRMGAKFLVTQLFFDNRLYFDYVARLRAMGADVPVVPGVLPIMNLRSAKFILGLCGAAIPGKYLSALEKANEEGGDEAVYALGIRYAIRQAQELIDGGAPGVHLYTLNRAEACLEIGKNLKI